MTDTKSVSDFRKNTEIATTTDEASAGQNFGWLKSAERVMDATKVDPDRNERRAARALLCIYPGYDSDTLQSALSDVLADIRHLCDLMDWNIADLDAKAHANYSKEVDEFGPSNAPDLKRSILDDLE